MTAQRLVPWWRVILCMVGWHRYQPVRDAELSQCAVCGATRQESWLEL